MPNDPKPLVEIVSSGLTPFPNIEKITTAEPDWCDNCGMCCYLRTPPFYGDGDDTLVNLPTHLKIEIDTFLDSPRSRGDDSEPCIWLDRITGKCKNYEYRPQVCREYEVGSPGCRASRSSVGLTIAGMPL